MTREDIILNATGDILQLEEVGVYNSFLDVLTFLLEREQIEELEYLLNTYSQKVQEYFEERLKDRRIDLRADLEDEDFNCLDLKKIGYYESSENEWTDNVTDKAFQILNEVKWRVHTYILEDLEDKPFTIYKLILSLMFTAYEEHTRCCSSDEYIDLMMSEMFDFDEINAHDVFRYLKKYRSVGSTNNSTTTQLCC